MSVAIAHPFVETPHGFQVFNVESVDDLFFFTRQLQDPRRFVFRGHRDGEAELEPKICRGIPDNYKQIVGLQPSERRMLTQFKQRAHHHLSPEQLPEFDDDLEWLSLIQHYGGPTRLLDFTLSIFLGAYFAIGTRNLCDEAAVWAINHDYMTTNFWRYYERHDSEFGDSANLLRHADEEAFPEILLLESIRSKFEVPATVLVRPTRHNKRLLQQQGVFIAPLHINIPFLDNLAAMFVPNISFVPTPSPKDIRKFAEFDNCAVIKFVIQKEHYSAMRTDLRNMNIRTESLFPDLEGEARALDDILTDHVLVPGLKEVV